MMQGNVFFALATSGRRSNEAFYEQTPATGCTYYFSHPPAYGNEKAAHNTVTAWSLAEDG
jgi:hypothetical protein